MAYLQNFVFLDENSTVTTSNPLVINSSAETLKLSVAGSGTLNVTVKGKIDRDAADFYDMASVKLEDYSVVATITAEGLYAVDVQGIKEVEIVNGGNAGDVTVFGVVVS